MPQKVAVVGAGIIGLASALLLAEEGLKVIVIARDLPGDGGIGWASPYAGATLIPPPEMGQQDMAKESIAWYQRLAEKDPSSGVRTVTATEYFTDRDTDDSIWYKDFIPNYKLLPQASLPPGCKVGYSFQTCLANPDVFLPWLKEKLESLGARFIRKEIESLLEAREMTGASIIVNASGLGAKLLAGDEAVAAYRGQTMFVKSDYDEVKLINGHEYTYVIPRMYSGGVILGGISQEDNIDGAVNTGLRQDILRRVNRMTGNAFANINLETDAIKDMVGVRPGRKGGIRVERDGSIVHAYGFKGAGYVYSFGAAAQVKRLVLETLQTKQAKL
ncbi:FAD dependent oxidoreductase [Exophiala viscosa]|uniref:FAD dependent oxidoreductase n=1 Tax=Exophiala viscosa TaxID=2486360 RepID=A0AAN6DXD9_9EURO|nr:FAD dependent oxidoreductase [Exophiala viscosa]KAI1626109.1 FAD dependent oxidoreductase [Exophiala viscosa]